MKQFIAGLNGIAYADNTAGGGADSFTNLSTINHAATGLLAGSLAVIGSHTATYDIGGVLATGTGISTLLAAGIDSFRIAVGRSANGAYLTNPIDIATLSVEGLVYAAGTAETATFVVPNIVTVAGDIGNEYTVVVDTLDKNPHDPTRRKRYTWTVQAAFETQVTIAGQLAAKITADLPESVATATNGGTATITFTGVVGSSFHVFGRGELALVTETRTAGTPSNGTYADMLALEKEASTERGKRSFNYLVSELYSSPSMLVAGVTYDVIKLKWKAPDSDQLAIKTQNPYQELTIACPAGGVYATLLNILTT